MNHTSPSTSTFDLDAFFLRDVANPTNTSSASGRPSSGGGGNDDDGVTAWLHVTLANIRSTFLPIIVAGTVTNVLNFIVLSHHEMRAVSTSVYLFALAVADLGVMYFELFRVWFEWTQFVDPTIYFTDSYCRLANYANGVVRDYSNWLIACVTLERLAMVACPYRARDFCSPVVVSNPTVAVLPVCLDRVLSQTYGFCALPFDEQ